MRRNIALAIATILLVAAASAASAATASYKDRTDTAQNSYRFTDQQDRFQVGY